MPKVTMALSDGDARNASEIQETTDARSKAHALSIALSLTRFVIDRLLNGDELVFRTRDGRLERVLMPELENLRRNKGDFHHSAG
ncbi:hypothetical protein [Methylobacterium sp.]|uniref:hypothetical protein n=1 Tax=Methylobacterium sp. TaxID=409 RepID=UPI00258020A5|nr:hypothetical protein [Methylobacterium sp.]